MIRKIIRRFLSRFSIIGELFAFLWKNKLWWMIPMVTVFLLLGFLIFMTQSPAVVPFIYALF